MSNDAVSERDIQRWLYYNVQSRFRVLIPNYTPFKWFECDMFAVTRANIMWEYEIKISPEDLEADKKKGAGRWRWDESEQRRRWCDHTKHDQLAMGDINGPQRFWYVVPEGMASAGDVPDWAGLQYAKLQPKRDHHAMTYGYLRVIKKAPRLHKKKLDEKVIAHALGVCYARFWRERLALDQHRMKVGA